MNNLSSLTLERESQIHLKKINDMLYVRERSFIVTASADGTCKIIDRTSLAVVKQLTFRSSISDKENFLIRCLAIHGRYLITLQCPTRGSSYVTKWDMSRNFNPVVSRHISSSVCAKMILNGNTLAIGETTGQLIQVSADDLSINRNKKVHDLAINSICNTSNFKSCILTSSPDSMILLHDVASRGFISALGLLKFLVLVVLGFYIYLRITEYGKH